MAPRAATVTRTKFSELAVGTCLHLCVHVCVCARACVCVYVCVCVDMEVCLEEYVLASRRRKPHGSSRCNGHSNEILRTCNRDQIARAYVRACECVYRSVLASASIWRVPCSKWNSQNLQSIRWKKNIQRSM